MKQPDLPRRVGTWWPRGLHRSGSTPEHLARYAASQRARWARIVRGNHITAE